MSFKRSGTRDHRDVPGKVVTDRIGELLCLPKRHARVHIRSMPEAPAGRDLRSATRPLPPPVVSTQDGDGYANPPTLKLSSRP